MKRPPMWIHLKIQGRNKKFNFWLPLFLILLLPLLVLILLSPLILVAIIILWPSGWGKWALLVLRDAFGVICSLRGLRIDIRGHHQCVYISIV